MPDDLGQISIFRFFFPFFGASKRVLYHDQGGNTKTKPLGNSEPPSRGKDASLLAAAQTAPKM